MHITLLLLDFDEESIKKLVDVS